MNQVFTAILILTLSVLLLHAAAAQDHGVVTDRDGFTNLREKPSAESAVVAKVKVGEVFEYDSVENSDWWKVTLTSGKTGWMHRTRIRMHFTLDEIPEKDEEGSEVAYYGKEHGFDYNATARGAAKEEPKALKRFFGINDTDGGAAETHAVYFCQVMHLLGDDKLSEFLKDQPLAYQMDVRHELLSGMVLWPFEDSTYTERNFPKTSKLLCRKVVEDWPSPDGQFAIRKTFTGERPTQQSKVMKAELIEKATGKAVANLTASDIGKGIHREGQVLWSPDSRRFAYGSGELRGGGKAQVVVFQREGSTFNRVELPLVALPGRANDAELKDAKHLWQFEEAARWAQPEVLEMLHHDYFESIRKDRSIHSIGRTYDVTYDFTTGTATAKVKKFGE